MHGSCSPPGQLCAPRRYPRSSAGRGDCSHPGTRFPSLSLHLVITGVHYNYGTYNNRVLGFVSSSVRGWLNATASPLCNLRILDLRAVSQHLALNGAEGREGETPVPRVSLVVQSASPAGFESSHPSPLPAARQLKGQLQIIAHSAFSGKVWGNRKNG